MDLAQFKNRLHNFIADDNILQCLLQLKKQIATDSDLRDVIVLLHDRLDTIKLNSIKGAIDFHEENRQTNSLRKNILDLIELMDEEDLIEEDIPKSIERLVSKIEEQQVILKETLNQKSEGVIQMGEKLHELGSKLRKRPDLNSPVSPIDIIKASAKKGYRRLKIGHMHMKEMRAAILQSFQALNSAYSELVYYLDFPKEQLNTEQIGKVKLKMQALQSYISNLENRANEEPDYLHMTKQAMGQLILVKEQLGNDFDSFFQVIDLIDKDVDEALIYFHESDQQLNTLTTKLKATLAELYLNIKEW